MAKRRAGILGVFTQADVCAQAIRAVKETGSRDFIVYSPVPDHQLSAAIDEKTSSVGYITLLGALTGTVSGFSLAAYATLKWHLIVWGKPFLSWLPWVVIGFEFTILFGGLTNFITMLLMSGLPRLRVTAGHDPRFSNDHYGVFVPCDPDQRERFKSLLQEQGAVEVHERDD
jgi:hypothetical protein